jgi:putative FmdB family regulatory protein
MRCIEINNSGTKSRFARLPVPADFKVYMPIYEYYCSSCKSVKEIIQKVSDPEAASCPDCKKKTLKKMISRSFGVQFSGSGFYETDYKKKSGCSGSCSSCSSSCGCGKKKPSS